MNPDFKDISVITDIAANTFAVFLLILLLLLAVRGDPTSLPADVQTSETALDVEQDMASTLRTPLRPEDIIDMLYDRRSGAPGTQIELFDDRVEILTGNGSRELAAGRSEPAASIAAPLDAPISLYVFDHRYYNAIVTGLLAAKSTWQELSVPQALRGRDPATGREDWSAGFLALLAQRPARANFRLELARLLGSPQPADAASSQGNAKSGYGAFGLREQLPTSLAEELLRRWRMIADAAIVLAGLLFVFLVEAAGRPLTIEPGDSQGARPI